MQPLFGLLAATGGAALFFAYGLLKPGIGDTLQAVRAHAYDGIFDHPGEADLTSHVDFSALACICLLYTSPSPRDRTRSRMPSSS